MKSLYYYYYYMTNWIVYNYTNYFCSNYKNEILLKDIMKQANDNPNNLIEKKTDEKLCEKNEIIQK